MYDNILFDFDGTVFDTVEGITRSVQYAANKQGLEPELAELRCFAGPPLTDMFMEHFGFSRERAERAVCDFRERYVPIGLYESRAFPGMRELLEGLRAAGKRLAVATSKPQRLAEELLERERMRELFDVICGSTPGGNDDAKWQVLSRALEELGAGAESSVLVGDTKYDVEGARRCGVKSIGVRYGYAAPGELEKAGADYIAEDLRELERLLLG